MLFDKFLFSSVEVVVLRYSFRRELITVHEFIRSPVDFILPLNNRNHSLFYDLVSLAFKEDLAAAKDGNIVLRNGSSSDSQYRGSDCSNGCGSDCLSSDGRNCPSGGGDECWSGDYSVCQSRDSDRYVSSAVSLFSNKIFDGLMQRMFLSVWTVWAAGQIIILFEILFQSIRRAISAIYRFKGWIHGQVWNILYFSALIFIGT